MTIADLARSVHRALADLAATPEDDEYRPEDLASLIIAAEKLAEAIVGSTPDHECQFDTYSAETHSRCYICGMCDGC